MTIRASNCLAAITGTLGFFAIGSAHADTSFGAAHLGAAHFASTPTSKIVTEVGFFREDDCQRPTVHVRKPCKRWRPPRRHVHRFPRPWPPYYGGNYEIYTYRRPYALPPRTDVQWVYGRYRGYYYPYPHYPGAGYDVGY
jgi:hypothetical protein